MLLLVSQKSFQEPWIFWHRENQAKNSSKSKMANRWTRDRFGMLKGLNIQQRTGNASASMLFQNAPFPDLSCGTSRPGWPRGGSSSV
jgi:hypothetical protein